MSSSRYLRLSIAPAIAKRAMPKINGSSAGFIALIVALSLIIIVSCASVFYLLRTYEPSEDDRAIRRQRSRHYQEQTDPSPAFTYTTTSSWTEKVGGMFGIGQGRRNAAGGASGTATRGRRGGGWIQAGSGDEWDESERGEQRVRFSPMPTRGVDSPFRPPSQSQHGDSDSIRLDVNLPGPLDVDPYAPVPQASQSTSSFGQHLPPSSSFMPRSTSPETLPGESTPPPVRTFEGGTKFIESF